MDEIDRSRERITVRGASEGVLDGADLAITLGQLICFAGRCGSGARTMAVDVLAAESRRRFSQSLSGTERLGAGNVARVEAEEIAGLPPAVLIRSTFRGDLSVGEYLAVHDLLAQLFCALADVHCPQCEGACRSYSVGQAVGEMIRSALGEAILVIGPLRLAGTASVESTLSELQRAGYRRIRKAGRVMRLEDAAAVAAEVEEGGECLYIVVDRLTVKSGEGEGRLAEAIRSARAIGRGRCMVVTAAGEGEEVWLNQQLTCTLCGADYGHLSREDFAVESGGGKGQSPAAMATLADTSFEELTQMTVDEVYRYAAGLTGSGAWGSAPSSQSEALIQALQHHLASASSLLVGHIPMSRSVGDLSEGERMRLTVAASLTRGLVGVLYVIPSPLSALDAEARTAVLKALRSLVDAGNTALLLDNDDSVMAACDAVVPFAAGRAVARTDAEVAGVSDGVSAVASDGESAGIDRDHQRSLRIRSGDGGPGNLAGLDLEIPLEQLVVVSGISGAGKTLFVRGLLLPSLAGRTPGRRRRRSAAEGTSAIEVQADGIQRVVDLTDPADGVRERQTVMAVLGLFPTVARLYAEAAADRGLTFPAEWFQLDGAGGRCTRCSGRGRLDCEMDFLEDLSLVCPVCEGRRFKADILEVTRRGVSIADVLAMSVEEATHHFSANTRLAVRLQGAGTCGLQSLCLGTASSDLERGELLRLRLAAELSRASSKDLLLLDRAGAGCHADDLSLLVGILRSLVEAGASVFVADSDPRLASCADWVVELGPGRGGDGGRVLNQGAPGLNADCADRR